MAASWVTLIPIGYILGTFAMGDKEAAEEGREGKEAVQMTTTSTSPPMRESLSRRYRPRWMEEAYIQGLLD